MRAFFSGVGARSAFGSGLAISANLLLGVVLSSSAAADSVPSPLIVAAAAGDPGEVAVAGVRTQLDPVLYRIVKDSPTIRFEGFALGKNLAVDLDLEQFDVLTPDAQLIVADGQKETLTERPDMILLRGSVVGDPTSLVVIALSPYGTNGLIRSKAGQFMIASSDDGSGGAYVYNTKDAADVAMLPVVCQGGLTVPGNNALADDLAASGQGGSNAPGGFESTSCRTINIAVDTDWEYRSIARFTSDAAAQTYAITLWGSISEIYRRDVNVSLAVPYVRIWSANTDPYPDGSSIGDRLGQFVDHWRNYRWDVSRQIAHLLSGTSGGGVAYLTVLCNKTWGYGADGNIAGTFPKPLKDHNAQNWDVMVAAHELGHNFAAPHTHDMTPPVDGCGTGDCTLAYGGTIMSYCHTCSGGMTNIVLKFADRTINETMLPYLNGGAATCGSFLNTATITQQPQAYHQARAGTKTSFTLGATGDALTYSWTFNSKVLVDGPQTYGSIVSGATTSTLTISNLSIKDLGTYRATVANTCSSASSTNATLSIRCAADMDLNTVVDLADFFSFLNSFDTSDLAADMNGDDQIDLADFFAFLNAFDKGC